MPVSSLTLRIKRQKTTYFITASATDTILAVKRRIAKLVSKDARDIRLLAPKEKIASTVDYAALTSGALKLAELEDKAVLDHLNVPDEAVLFMAFWISDVADGKWEPVEVAEPSPIVDPMSESEDAAAAAKASQ
ncbi:hypothetical protein BCR44DRAFT_35261 [Catenaria anguillulae PL171]|uniref:Ubiquitin-like domain-containing protein n=1 Tax=Catenaria anguillulae PL171 TaxID=765915 RepID=A0A1Y2HYT3_9FUNG|nr:hypothetical protein BCR44DRAFT_35261 [Catenaria anguillulae PL171]